MKILLGQPVSLSMLLSSLNSEEKRYFHGIVSGTSNSSRDQFEVERDAAEVVPWMWLLKHRVNSRIFEGKTAVEIITAIFDEMKVSVPQVNYRDDTIGSDITLDYCV